MLKNSLKKSSFLSKLDLPYPLQCMIPLYHCVSDDHLSHISNVIQYKSVQDFEKDLDDMSKHFEFTDWENFKKNKHKSSKKPLALLTFDDGLIEFKEVVVPILEKKGIYAINFINPAFVEGNEMMFRFKASLILEKLKTCGETTFHHISKEFQLNNQSKDGLKELVKRLGYNNQEKLVQIGKLLDIDFEEYRKKQKIYLNDEDLNSLKAKGFGISAHSWDHPYFFDLNIDEQLESAQKSLNYCTENGFIDDAFAFPFTDFGVYRAFFEILFEQNPQLKFTFGTAGIKLDSFPKNLQRIPMEKGFSAEAEISFEKLYFFTKKIINKNTIVRK